MEEKVINTVVIGPHCCADGTGPRAAWIDYRLDAGQGVCVPVPNGHHFRVFQDEDGPTTIAFYRGDILVKAMMFAKYSGCEIAISDITRIKFMNGGAASAGRVSFSVVEDECDVPVVVERPTLFGYSVVVDDSVKPVPVQFGTFKEYMG